MFGKFNVARLCGIITGYEDVFDAVETFLNERGVKFVRDDPNDDLLYQDEFVVVVTPGSVDIRTYVMIQQATHTNRPLLFWENGKLNEEGYIVPNGFQIVDETHIVSHVMPKVISIEIEGLPTPNSFWLSKSSDSIHEIPAFLIG